MPQWKKISCVLSKVLIFYEIRYCCNENVLVHNIEISDLEIPYRHTLETHRVGNNCP